VSGPAEIATEDYSDDFDADSEEGEKEVVAVMEAPACTCGLPPAGTPAIRGGPPGLLESYI
jgi:hypothetical protein